MKTYHGVGVYDFNAQQGVNGRKRNPRKKNRLPYHAKAVRTLPVMGKVGNCPHSLAQHEEINLGGPDRVGTVSYALPCVSKHSSPKVQHRDTTGRKW